MEGKFKIGDKVKLLDKDYHTYGKIGVVTCCVGDIYCARCLEDEEDEVLSYWEYELEAVVNHNNKIVITSDGVEKEMKRIITQNELVELYKLKIALDSYTDLFAQDLSSNISCVLWSAWRKITYLLLVNDGAYGDFINWCVDDDLPIHTVIEDVKQ